MNSKLAVLLTVADDLSLDCGQLFFEAGEVFVESPNKSLVGPERRLRALPVAVGGGRARRPGL